ncbi:hypothetical protein [Kocuria palustris]|uniref:hypothetical protein n=1 Tax=Kocuria palustris TaxID=71999 RepID=UPI00119D3530|nr:hypothetical protein [Kocuria palustris]
MGSTALPSFVSRARLVSVVTSVAALLLLGVLLLGWFAGSRTSSTAGAGSAAVPGSPWAQSSGLLLTDISDVDLLRSQGWTLPLAGAPGYEVSSLRQVTVAGEPAVRMTMRDQQGESYTLVEQRGEVDPQHPVDGLVGLPSTTTGLDPAAVDGTPVRMRAGSPWTAQIVHDDVVYTLQGDGSAAGMVRLIHHTEAADRATLIPAPERESTPGETVVDGWKRMLGLDA